MSPTDAWLGPSGGPVLVSAAVHEPAFLEEERTVETRHSLVLDVLWLHDPSSSDPAFAKATETLRNRGWTLDMQPNVPAALSQLRSRVYGAAIVDWPAGCAAAEAVECRLAFIQQAAACNLGVVVFRPTGGHYPTEDDREQLALAREACVCAGARDVVSDDASLDTALGEASRMPSFILYAMPCGPLAEKLQAFQDEVLVRFGRNKQHEYRPHCTLTGFFRTARPGALRPLLVEAFLRAVERHPSLKRPRVEFKVRENNVRMDLAETEELERFARDFRAQLGEHAPAVRVKSNLHVSMAHGFDPRHQRAIEGLARERVDPASEVRWELRLYERLGADGWTVLAATDLA